MKDPIWQDLRFSRSRRTVRNRGGGLRARCSQSGRSNHALSFFLGPIDGFSDTSKLRIWLRLRALDAIEAIGQLGELIIGVASCGVDGCLERRKFGVGGLRIRCSDT
jgi:hypothetical protein